MRGLSVEFFVPGDPVGYTIALNKRADRVRRYHGFCERVRWEARRAGVPLPLMATKDRPAYIYTQAVFKGQRFPDPENVHKGVKDALFYATRGRGRGRGDDRWTGGLYEAPAFAETPDDVGTWVTIEWGTRSGIT